MPIITLGKRGDSSWLYVNEGLSKAFNARAAGCALSDLDSRRILVCVSIKCLVSCSIDRSKAFSRNKQI